MKSTTKVVLGPVRTAGLEKANKMAYGDRIMRIKELRGILGRNEAEEVELQCCTVINNTVLFQNLKGEPRPAVIDILRALIDQQVAVEFAKRCIKDPILMSGYSLITQKLIMTHGSDESIKAVAELTAAVEDRLISSMGNDDRDNKNYEVRPMTSEDAVSGFFLNATKVVDGWVPIVDFMSDSLSGYMARHVKWSFDTRMADVGRCFVISSLFEELMVEDGLIHKL